MVRIKHAGYTHRRKKRILKKAKGQFGHKKSRFKQAVRSLIKGRQFAYRDRKVKKREFRQLWITRISAGCAEAGLSYSRFIQGLTASKISIDRRMLAELAVSAPEAFKKLVEASKQAAAPAPAKATSKAKKA